MNYIQRAAEVLDIEVAGIKNVKAALGDEFIQAVDAILETIKNGGKVVVTGVGKNFHIGNKLVATLTSTGTPSVILHPIEAMHGDFGILSERDILLALSYSGASDELVALLQPVKRQGVKIIAMTGEFDSPLAEHSDILLSVRVEQEACPFNMAPTTSTTATLALGDALAMVLLQARGFEMKDYATPPPRRCNWSHPASARGRCNANRRPMRHHPRRANPLREALIAMTGAQSGCVAIVDAENTLKGILTDGDLRRHLIQTPDLLEQSVESIMTPDPITLTKDKLALEILNIYESRNIDDLIVVDSQNRVIGSVDIQDLPKLKIL